MFSLSESRRMRPPGQRRLVVPDRIRAGAVVGARHPRGPPARAGAAARRDRDLCATRLCRQGDPVERVDHRDRGRSVSDDAAPRRTPRRGARHVLSRAGRRDSSVATYSAKGRLVRRSTCSIRSCRRSDAPRRARTWPAWRAGSTPASRRRTATPTPPAMRDPGTCPTPRSAAPSVRRSAARRPAGPLPITT